MDFDDYQKTSKKTLISNNPPDLLLARMGLGLTGEAGEVAEKIKKILLDKDVQLEQKDKDEIAKELGDVLWYMARLAEMVDHKLSEVAYLNLDKLNSRNKRNKISGSGDNR